MNPSKYQRKTKEDFIDSKRSRWGKKLPHLLSKQQLITMLRRTSDPALAMAMFVSVFQGLRIGEMSFDKNKSPRPLKWENVNLDGGELFVLDAKNTHRYEYNYGKDRKVPVFNQFISIYKMWRAMNPDAEYVLPSPFDKSMPMTSRCLQDRYNGLIMDCGLLIPDYYQKDGHPRYKFPFHNLRHNCGTQLVRLGWKLPAIRDLMGHEDIGTTMIYINLVNLDQREMMNDGYRKAKEINGYAPKIMPVRIEFDKENLLLQREILEKQLELARMQNQGVKYELLPQQEV